MSVDKNNKWNQKSVNVVAAKPQRFDSRPTLVLHVNDLSDDVIRNCYSYMVILYMLSCDYFFHNLMMLLVFGI
jgi:hypothetical protein